MLKLKLSGIAFATIFFPITAMPSAGFAYAYHPSPQNNSSTQEDILLCLTMLKLSSKAIALTKIVFSRKRDRHQDYLIPAFVMTPYSKKLL
ncbi:MAG: hypothetical protein WBG70_21745 [Spirulinaceae cyanobacterium]